MGFLNAGCNKNLLRCYSAGIKRPRQKAGPLVACIIIKPIYSTFSVNVLDAVALAASVAVMLIL